MVITVAIQGVLLYTVATERNKKGREPIVKVMSNSGDAEKSYLSSSFLTCWLRVPIYLFCFYHSIDRDNQ
jgi:hypothetical protein